MSEVLEPTFEGDYTFAREQPFVLDGGASLQPVTLRYALYGELNARRDNAILVCHALSGSARVADWWPEMIGSARALDPSRHCIIGINVLGSCYGSTGAPSPNPATGRAYAGSFPLITIRDMVRAQKALIDHLGVTKLRAVVGGSIGGMQALQWTLSFPDFVERCVAIAATPLSAMGLALNHLQRQAIRSDPAWRQGNYLNHEPPRAGLALARALAICSYKSPGLFQKRYGRRPNRNGEVPIRSFDDRFDVAGYLDYQGELFNRRFDANTYLVLSKAMDNFEIASNSQSEEEVLKSINAEVFLVALSEDWLFPPGEVEDLAGRMRAAGIAVQYTLLESAHGHDGFLADAVELSQAIAPWLSEAPGTSILRHEESLSI